MVIGLAVDECPSLYHTLDRIWSDFQAIQDVVVTYKLQPL